MPKLHSQSLAHLGHLDALDGEAPDLGIGAPAVPPLVPRNPEIRHGRQRAVQPRLLPLAIGEPAVRSADSEVEGEVELLVERRDIVARVDPGVVEAHNVARGAVRVGSGELAALPEGLLVESERDDLGDTAVNV